MEVKIEKAEPRDENDPTPLRVEESPARACSVDPDHPTSNCGWDSDPDDGVQRSAPPNPDTHLDAIELKDEFKIDPDLQMLDDLYDDLPDVNPEMCIHPPLPSLRPPPPPPPPTTTLDGIPSAFTARENLEDMDLCSLGASDDELFAEKLEILQKLAKVTGNEKEGGDEQKKKKKSKKRKRSHRSSKDKEKEDETEKRVKSSSSPDESQKENKRRHDSHWPGRRIKNEKEDLDYVPVRAEERRVRVVKPSNLLERQAPKIAPRMENLSKQDKRQLGVARAQLALQLFRKTANKDDEVEALMVATMCKLPVHESFRNQNSFENPSPLCNNMNVVYEFNSAPGTRIDLAKWGLEKLPQPIRELCRILGIDIHRLKELQRTAIPSQRILKLKKEQMEREGGSEEAEADKATLYKNAGTQTDRKTSTHDAGTQARIEAPPRGATFWQHPEFDEVGLTQQQSNVMYALQELCRSLPDPVLAGRVYRSLGPTLATSRLGIPR